MTIDLAFEARRARRDCGSGCSTPLPSSSPTTRAGEINSPAGDQHLADHATDLVDRELDQSLGENAENVVAEIDAAIARIDDGNVRNVRDVRRCDPGGAARRRPVRDPLPRRQAAAGTRVSEPARSAPPRRVDVRDRLVDERPAADLGRRATTRRRARAVDRARRDRRHGDRRRPADEGDRLRAAARSGTRPSRSGRSASITSRTPGSPSASSPTRPRR